MTAPGGRATRLSRRSGEEEVGVTVPDGNAAPRSFVEKLNHLFNAVRDPRGEPYSPEYVSAWLRTNDGPTMSTSYLYMLRKGERDNPTKSHIEALAQFFQVPPAYFFDDELTDRVNAQLDLLAAIRGRGVRDIAMRSAALHDDARQIVTDLLNSLEGFRTRPPGSTRPDRSPRDPDAGERDRPPSDPDGGPPDPTSEG